MEEKTLVLFDKLEKLASADWMRTYLADEGDHPNFWRIIEYGRDSYEIRYSRMLRWLMDPRGNHGLGPHFARMLAQRAGLNVSLDGYAAVESDAARVEALKTQGSFGGIDVLYHEEDQNLLIAIENKTGSHEHNAGTSDQSQLDAYAEKLDVDPQLGTMSRFVNRAYIFLTPDGEVPRPDTQTRDRWTTMTYREIISILDVELGELRRKEAHAAVKIISDFRDDIRLKFYSLANHEPTIRAEFEPYRPELGLLAGRLGLADATASAAAEPTPTGARSSAAAALERGFEKRFAGRTSIASSVLSVVYSIVTAPRQNHDRNVDSQRAIRMLFNAIVGQSDRLDVSDEARFGGEPATARNAPITADRLRKHGLHTIRLTKGKGQGVYLEFEPDEFSVYISANADGEFPNVGCQLLKNHRERVLQLTAANTHPIDPGDPSAQVQSVLDELSGALDERSQEMDAAISKFADNG